MIVVLSSLSFIFFTAISMSCMALSSSFESLERGKVNEGMAHKRDATELHETCPELKEVRGEEREDKTIKL